MNYTKCSDEQIEFPGKIQGFGYLLGLDDNFNIQFYSQNILDLFLISEIKLHSKLENNDELFNIIKNSDVYKKVVAKDSSFASHLSCISIHGTKYYLTIRKKDHLYYLEFESCITADNIKEIDYINFDAYNDATSEIGIWENLLKDISYNTDYDRIMIYKFFEDGSGKVVAEQVKNGVESFLHLHYPESDIPKQARELYLTKKRRIFSDINGLTSPIISRSNDVDLSCTELRAMSPIHEQYLRNLGVCSSFSTSIIVDGVLWGLVACQNILPKHIDLRNRIRSEIYTLWAAKAYSNIKSAQLVQYSIEIDQQISAIKNKLSKSLVLTTGIVQNFSDFCAIAKSDGVALVSTKESHSYGNVPSELVISNIIKYFQKKNFDKEKVFFYQSFAKEHPEIVGDENSFAGIAISKINHKDEKYFIWFREEFIKTIRWAGNPEKHYEFIQHNGMDEIGVSPRKSFKTFIEESRKKSKFWNEADKLAIQKLITLIFEISYDHYSKIRKLSEDLILLNEELESFSYTISHDLGTPLTVMKLNLQMLERKLLEGHTEGNLHKLSKALEQIQNMEKLMRDVLNLSRAKSGNLESHQIQMRALIERVANEAQSVYGTPNTFIKIGDCKDILSDHTLIYQVFLNIISNAVKYSSTAEFPMIEINSEESNEYIIYSISDNGIGIPDSEKNQMFKIFKRLENAKKFYGNGIGLNIVYKIMQRLGGTIDFHNNTDAEGVTFRLQFKKDVFD